MTHMTLYFSVPYFLSLKAPRGKDHYETVERAPLRAPSLIFSMILTL